MGNVNDLMSSAATTVVADGNADTTGRGRLMGYILTAGSDTATLTIYDAATAAGDDPLKASAVLNTTTSQWFGPQGVRIETGVSTALTGTGAVGHFFWTAG